MDKKLLPTNKNVIRNKFNFPYIESQLVILDTLIKWIRTPYKDRDGLQVLQGAGGTGKTTIIKDLINSCNTTVCVSATTHKAVRVISEATGRKGFTIQKLCGLRPKYNIDNFDINNIKFAVQGEPHIQYYKVIIIDEGSQLGYGITELIKTFSIKYKVKVLFIGDEYQMPPVKEERSHIFDLEHVHTLTDIVRQEKGNPLLELLALSRYDVKHGTAKVIEELRRTSTKVNDKGYGYFRTDTKNYSEGLYKYCVSNKFQDNIDFVRSATYTNLNALQWNSYIRNRIFDNRSGIIQANDIITCYNTIVDEFISPVIINSEDYKVTKSMLYVMNDTGIKGYLTIFQSIYDGRLTKYLFVVDHEDEANFNKFMKLHTQFHNDARYAGYKEKTSMWKRYYEFKDKYLLLMAVYEQFGRVVLAKDVDIRYKRELIVDKDIDYGFSMTIHKTQGSTYNNIFMNLANIINSNQYNNSKQRIFRNKLIYVGLSRAREKAIILL